MRNLLITTCALLSVVILTLSPITYAASRQYPPYRNIWGYDLSSHETVQTSKMDITAFRIKNGDYWFRFPNFIKEDKNNGVTKYSMLEFFAMRTNDNYYEFISGKNPQSIYHKQNGSDRIVEQIKNIRGIYYLEAKKIQFSNGNTLEIEINDTTCWRVELALSRLIMRDKSGNEIGKYAIVAVSSKPEIVRAQDVNDSNECGPKNLKYVYRQFYPVHGGLILLEDDTFLLYPDNGSMIVRFRQDLTTSFESVVNYKTYNGKTLTRNLFVLPYKQIEQMALTEARAGQPAMQGLQDALIELLAN